MDSPYDVLRDYVTSIGEDYDALSESVDERLPGICLEAKLMQIFADATAGKPELFERVDREAPGICSVARVFQVLSYFRAEQAEE